MTDVDIQSIWCDICKDWRMFATTDWYRPKEQKMIVIRCDSCHMDLIRYIPESYED